jgi:hypothetical protein
MTKQEIIKALESLPDDSPLTLWVWDGHKSREFYINPVCQDHTDRLVLTDSHVEVKLVNNHLE